MQAVVKTPHTEIVINGVISKAIIDALEKEYGDAFRIVDDESDIDVFESQWYRSIKASITPGDYLKHHRERMQMTQAELGERLGGIPRQHISNMERGVRPISVKMAKLLAEVFGGDFSIFIRRD
jgi:DNA-binding XRE family transcriptional regulator